MDENAASFDILKDGVAHSAFHNSGTRFSPPKCHPNTRVAVLNKIMSWIQDCEAGDWLRIMWLTGAAGAGKSAIAQSLIELCLSHSQDLIIASFFFGRSDGTRNHGGSFIATLVYQIYHSIPAVQERILSVIAGDPLILTKSLENQFVELVAKPLRDLLSGTPSSSGHHHVVVIDGLDECLDRAVQQEILSLISSGIKTYDIPVLFLIISRPEHDISVSFNSNDMDGIFIRLYLDDTYHPDEDIRRFLGDSFEKIKLTHPFNEQIPPFWPTPDTVEYLVKKSSGQFIYAATVIGYVQSIRHNPYHRLDIVMKLRPPQGNLPFAQLDALYAMILSSAEDIQRVLYALSIFSLAVSSGDPLDVSRFMSLDHGELDLLFCDLGALVSVDTFKDSYRILKILHASLHDFLLDPVRSKEYFIDINVYRPKLLVGIINYVAPQTRDDNPDCTGMDTRAGLVRQFFRNNIRCCETSNGVMEHVSSFPLARVFSIIRQRQKDESFNLLARFLYFGLFTVVSDTRVKDVGEDWSMTEKRYEKEFDAFFLSQMPSYYSDSNLTSLLCLVCHSGKDKLLPGFLVNSGNIWIIYSQFHPSFRNVVEYNDVLLLHRLELNRIDSDKHPYQRLFTSFMQDPTRAGKYALGPETYAKVTIFFMETLQQETWPVTNRDCRLTEDGLSRKTVFQDDIWKIEVLYMNDHDRDTRVFVKTFLLLGYIAFFLPRCAESQTLLQYCEQQAFLTQKVKDIFPVRSGLACEAMEDYLKRFTRKIKAWKKIWQRQ